jgi:GTPase
MFKSGFVSIIGRPNSGKSTLLNQLLGEKISIVSDKPQTTRENILGILTSKEGQIVFTDTPGIHKPGYELNRRMMQTVYDALEGKDLLLLIVDAATSFGSGDQYVLDLIKPRGLKTFLLLNKIDLLRKDKLLPLISLYSQKFDFAEVIPVSAMKRDNLDLLVRLILKYLPEGGPHFPEEQFTDRHERFLVAEIVREKVLSETHEELPYSTTVVVTRFDESQEDLVLLYCDIVVEKESQRKIVIGSQGQKLKQIGTEARIDIEKLLGKRVYLELYVRVKTRWRDDPRFLDRLRGT